jgi:predicted ribosomally synthesized peptide with nif11-like leader
MKEEVKRLHEDLLSDRALQGKLREALESGAPEEIARVANALGYQIDAADLASPSLEEVDDDELEAVSGGTEANDHHDVGCLWGLLWYADWDEANYKCCPHGQKLEGWLHFVQSYGYHTYKCVRCGYVFTNVEDGDVKDKFGFRSYLP